LVEGSYGSGNIRWKDSRGEEPMLLFVCSESALLRPERSELTGFEFGAIKREQFKHEAHMLILGHCQFAIVVIRNEI